MPKAILFFFGIIFYNYVSAQNLVVNPSAESLPRGTGWTIVSAGVAACTFAPTTNYLNWTMIPNGTANYPFDHTTGAAGGTIFYSGCSAAFQGPFELQQTIDVSADAVTIDFGAMPYTFDGFMQTPVSNQTDRGRFIVDYLNAANVVLGTSYTSNWQSYFGGSGTGWVYYTSTRQAPVGTRSIRIRMQTQLFFNQYAINVYFDDITLTRPFIVPVNLISFTGNESDKQINLYWTAANEINLAHYELEQSNDGTYFTKLASFPGGNNSYTYKHKKSNELFELYYYRLKMTDTDGRISYSRVLPIKVTDPISFKISPNPAKNFITISGIKSTGTISIIHVNGATLFTSTINNQSTNINIASYPPGFYIVRFSDGKKVQFKKLVIRDN